MLIVTFAIFKQVEITSKVTFVVFEKDAKLGDIVLGLYGKVVPKTVKNFLEISKKHKNEANIMTYDNTLFHRVIEEFMIQGGDFEFFDGNGGYSIYGRSFPDENFQIPFRPYVLAMANEGSNSNGAQWFITVNNTNWLNGHHVVFGEVLSGMNTVLHISKVETDNQDKPLLYISIKEVIVEDHEHEPVQPYEFSIFIFSMVAITIIIIFFVTLFILFCINQKNKKQIAINELEDKSLIENAD